MEQSQLPHKLTLDERRKLVMTGATEVVSFEENLVVLRTGLGVLNIHGQELQLKNLSLENGQVAVEGKIGALIYEEPRERGWLSRLLG